MKRWLAMLAIIVGFVGVTSNIASAEWSNLLTVDGVDVFWRILHPNYKGDNYMAELKLANRNDHTVDVTYSPQFTCRDGAKPAASSGMSTLRAGQTAAGQYAGLWFVDCGSVGFARVNIQVEVKRR